MRSMSERPRRAGSRERATGEGRVSDALYERANATSILRPLRPLDERAVRVNDVVVEIRGGAAAERPRRVVAPVGADAVMVRRHADGVVGEASPAVGLRWLRD